MLYTTDNTSFKHQVHPSLQRRIRIFLILGLVMLVLIALNVIHGTLSIQSALASVIAGSLVGFVSSRIFNLSWDADGEQVVGRIDTVGWIVLAAYVLFEVARSFIVERWLPSEAAAIGFAFIGPALITRVLSLRGRIIRVIKDEKVLG